MKKKNLHVKVSPFGSFVTGINVLTIKVHNQCIILYHHYFSIQSQVFLIHYWMDFLYLIQILVVHKEGLSFNQCHHQYNFFYFLTTKYLQKSKNQLNMLNISMLALAL